MQSLGFTPYFLMNLNAKSTVSRFNGTIFKGSSNIFSPTVIALG